MERKEEIEDAREGGEEEEEEGEGEGEGEGEEEVISMLSISIFPHII